MMETPGCPICSDGRLLSVDLVDLPQRLCDLPSEIQSVKTEIYDPCGHRVTTETPRGA